MGTEAIVEVHTPNECLHALECGATILAVNNWDRADGQWHPDQVSVLSRDEKGRGLVCVDVMGRNGERRGVGEGEIYSYSF